MAKKRAPPVERSERTHRGQLQPQNYEHRVECALFALAVGLDALRSLSEFLTEQQSPQWRDLNPLITDAERSLRKSLRWLRQARRH